jgi:hypothetical protein
MHNFMERQRRVELRSAFEMLNRVVPRLPSHVHRPEERLSKLAILARAREFCLSLKAREAKLRMRRDQLVQKRRILRSRLGELRNKDEFMTGGQIV